MFLEIVDKLLRYRLYDVLEYSGDMAHIARDLLRLNLLSPNEVNVINSTYGLYDHNGINMIAMMVSDNIINGDKNEFSKFSTYLKTLPAMKHFVEYLDRQCMLSLLDTKITFKINIFPLSIKLLCGSQTTGIGRFF